MITGVLNHVQIFPSNKILQNRVFIPPSAFLHGMVLVSEVNYLTYNLVINPKNMWDYSFFILFYQVPL